jgi:hypothetical protein
MKRKIILVFLLFASLITKKSIAQYQGLENLDSKYGFNKFKLEDPISKYKNSVKYLSVDNDGVKEYLYTGPSIGKVFGYFDLEELHLSFYKDKLKEINLVFGYLTEQNEQYIYNELIKLFDMPQKVGREDEYHKFFYAWLSDKTSLYYRKQKSPKSVSIQVISFKLVMDVQNNKF